MYPLLSIMAASAVSVLLRGWTNRFEPALLRLAIDTGMLFGIYAVVLLWVLGQKSEYAAILRQAGFWPSGSGSNG